MSTIRTIWADGQESMFKPDSDWVRPNHLPWLSGLDIGLDTETRDGGLDRGRGPGWVYKDGWLCGVSVAWGEEALYAPVRHPDTDNFPVSEVMEWVEYLLKNNRVHFFNISYDMGWLQAEGCAVWPECSEDGAAMAFVADENHQTYSLEDCCRRAGIPGKDDRLLVEALITHGVQKRDGGYKHGIHRLPARYVGPYAEVDARRALELCKALYPTLQAEGTVEAYRTEMDLFPVTNDMRWRGIRISEDAADRARQSLRQMRDEALGEIVVPWRGQCVVEDVFSSIRLKALFDHEGIGYPMTAPTKGYPEGQPSFQAAWLEKLEHPLGQRIRKVRQLHDYAEKFVGTYILEYNDRGRIHANINQLRAVTHRFSYSDPPLQQMPSRDGELAPLIRNIFLPEEGEQWLGADFKGQEPRLNIHYAYLARKDARKFGIEMGDIDGTVEYYRTDPNPDFHTLGATLLGLTRKAAKDLNQGLSYRMGAGKLALTLNIPEDEAKELWDLYHARIPYISGIAKYAEMRAKNFGYVRMIDGARRHFPLWQPKKNREAGGFAYREEAERKWPNQVLERAFSYQAGNSVIQGSASRQTKRAMVAMWKAGHRPLIQMHDEIGKSVSTARECQEIGEIMCSAVKLVIPVASDLEVGPTWGRAKTDYREVFK